MKNQDNIIKIAMADDHVLLRNALANLIADFEDCEIVLQADDGHHLIMQLEPDDLPDVLLLDLNMPIMDGFATAAWLHKKFPSIHILMLTMYDSDQAMVRLLQYGVKGFLQKDILPAELIFAIRSVVQSGFYFSQQVSGKLADLFRSNNDDDTLALDAALLSDQEIVFLKLASSDLTYKEIATQMNVTPRVVDNLRDILFSKLEVKSRVGLAICAIRQGIVAM